MEQHEELVRLLKNRGYTITTAESCTGGLIGAAIVEVSGASEVYNQGLITYSNEAKERLLGVNYVTLETHGAVSAETAREMALGAARSAGAEVALASTGIAGPGGGSRSKPVGLVYLGCYVRGTVTVQECRFSGSREAIRHASAERAVEMALECMKKE